MIHFEKRLNPSRITTIVTPILAVILTMVAGGIMFAALGKPPLEAIQIIFWDPLFDPNFASYSRPQLLVKAGPLILIAIGLSIGFKAGIWNIGAEGQYIMGAIFGAAVALAAYPAESIFCSRQWLLLVPLVDGFGHLSLPFYVPNLIRMKSSFR